MYSYISTHTAKTLVGRHTPRQPAHHQQVQLANGTTMRTEGALTLGCLLGGIGKRLTFQCLPNLANPLILGMDALTAFGATICTATRDVVLRTPVSSSAPVSLVQPQTGEKKLVQFLAEELPEVSTVTPACPWYQRMLQEVTAQPNSHPDYQVRDGKLHRRFWDPADLSDTKPHRGWKLCIPTEQRAEILAQSHDQPTAGHLGIAKTLARLALRYYWPGMFREAAKYVRRCLSCQQFHPGQTTEKPPSRRRRPCIRAMGSPLIRARRPEIRPQLPPVTQLHHRTCLPPTSKPEASPTSPPPALLVSRATSQQSPAEESTTPCSAESVELREALLQRYGTDPPEASPSYYRSPTPAPPGSPALSPVTPCSLAAWLYMDTSPLPTTPERPVTPRTPKWARQDLLDTLFGPSPAAAEGSPSPKAMQAVRVHPPTPFLAPGRRALRTTTSTTPLRRAGGVPARGAPGPARADVTTGITPLPTPPSAGAPTPSRDRWVRLPGDRPGGGVLWEWTLLRNEPHHRRRHRRRRR